MPLKIDISQHKVITRNAVREPQLYKLLSGDLLLTFHVQTDKHFAERCGLRSKDGGQTWLPEPRRAHREQAIGQGQNGMVLATDIYTFERRPGEYLGSFFRSVNGGAAFSGPHELCVRVNRVKTNVYPEPEHFPPDDHVMRKFYQPVPPYYAPTLEKCKQRLGPIFWRYIVEHQGRWLAPMQCRFHGDKFYRTILVASEDHGENWDFVSIIADFRDQTMQPGDGFCEPALITLPDNTLLCMMRRGGHFPLAQSRSTDGGLTWGRAEMLAGHGVDPDLCLLSSGMLACTYGRPGMSVMFSPDGYGKAWGYHNLIGEWPSSSYMGIAEIGPDELLLVYDRRENCKKNQDRDLYHIGSCRVKVTCSS